MCILLTRHELQVLELVIKCASLQTALQVSSHTSVCISVQSFRGNIMVGYDFLRLNFQLAVLQGPFLLKYAFSYFPISSVLLENI